MQRKRPRGYYSDTVELGASILPMRQMKKFTMTKLLKYFCLIVLGYCIYSMYQKISEVSKASEKADKWTDSLNEDAQVLKQNGETNNAKDIAERRVKEQINKVFEDFKHKQELKAKMENGQDVFKEYVDNIDNKNDDDGVDDMGEDDNDEFNGNVYNDGEEEDADDDFSEDMDDAFEQNADANVEDNAEDVDDTEQEHEALEVEKEIEERLAEVFKEAIHEAAEEIKDDNKDVKKQNEPLGVDKVDADKEVKIPEVQDVFEQKQFNIAVDRVGKQLNPLQIQQMNVKAARELLKQDQDHEFPPFITAARQTTFIQAKQLVASVQVLLPGRKVYIYDLDLTPDQKKELASYCNVRVHEFLKQLFPKVVSELDSLHWKPLVMQTALAEFGHMIWVTPGYRLATQELAPLIHDSHEQGVVVLGQAASFTTFAATHPDMLKFLPVDKEKLSQSPHIEIRAVFIHNSAEIHENVMKIFTSCALEESCLAPKGAQWQCKFDLTGKKYAGCHRYDESALNILLKNWFNYDVDKFAKRNSYFKKVDPSVKPKLAVCRQIDEKRGRDL